MTPKTLLTSAAAALFLVAPLAAPAAATVWSAATPTVSADTLDGGLSIDGKALARRGSDDRGGDDRGGHRRGGRDDDRREDRGRDRSSGRDKPRIPGGSGCDDPHDIIEHPECRV